MGKRLKGFFYTYDALIASGLIFTLIIIVLYYHTGEVYNAMSYDNINALANDMVTVLNTLQLKDLPQHIKEKILNETYIEYGDENKSLSDILTLLWVYHQENYSSLILNYVFNTTIVEYNYSVSINNLTTSILLYNTTYLDGGDGRERYVSVSKTMLSGYKISTNPLGYVARAYASKIRKNTTLVYPIYVGGAGYKYGIFNITKHFYVNVSSTDNIEDARAYIALHYGWYDSDFISLKVNGVELKDKITWLWEESAYTGRGALGYVSLKNVIRNGWNNFSMIFQNPPFNAHTHPGGRIEVVVSSNETFNQKNDVYKELFLDDIYSHDYSYWWHSYPTGAWESYDFSIPKGAQVNNVTLYLHLKDVEDSGDWIYEGGWYYEERDIIVYYNGHLIYENYHPSQSEYNLYFDVSSLSHEGTNYLLVYVNCYGNYFWGNKYTEIYSNPIEDKEHSSRIILNYTYTKNALEYGKIDVNVVENVGGKKENPKLWIKDLSIPEAKIYSSFAHVAQLFSYNVNVSFANGSNPFMEVFTSSGARDVPSSISIPYELWDVNGTNKMLMEDSCDGCDFLPESMVEYMLLIPSQVGYGKTFETKEEAIEDAISRLKSLISNVVELVEIKNDTSTISNVPWMYGPVMLEVKVWR